ncbi:MAG: hypothetical protein KJZ78_06135 [Bryobacteraceae bacterium]|nr:hypothetical protein [Bryobacteraceae bacterium]
MNKLLYIAVGTLAVAGFGRAEEKCQTIRGVLQAYLDPEVRFWVNEVHGVLDDTRMVVGKMTALAPATTSIDRGIGIDRDGLQMWDFGEDGALTVELPVGLHLRPAPGPQGFGVYRGMGRIVDGTGPFANATGTVLYEGSWVLWFLTEGDSPTPQGRWNADVTMRICKDQQVSANPASRRSKK